MSITFGARVHPADIVGFDIVCWECDTTVRYPDQTAATAAWPAEQADHARRSCRAKQMTLSAAWPDWPTLNVANSNGHDLLEVLGLVDGDDWYTGVIDADDLTGRILVALAVAPDPEIPGYVAKEPGRATVVQFDRPAGYLGERLEVLHRIAEHAKKLGRQVTWG